MQWNKEMATCCGSGGGLVLNFPNLAKDIAQTTISNALNTGANFLVTACPFCKSALAQAAERKGDISVVDLSEFVAKFLK
jgi:Fe-S oxidoreductase